jgi:Fur family peroxide stress response transcriptional regulator
MDLFYQTCRERGLKITPQREQIYKEICRSAKHPTADQVYRAVRRRISSITLDTVNRTLHLFVRAGLATSVESYGSARRYDPNVQPHHHLHCTECGKITDFEYPPFDRITAPAQVAGDFEVSRTRVVVSGICANCKKKQKRKVR